jgi:hypothetical protein
MCCVNPQLVIFSFSISTNSFRENDNLSSLFKQRFLSSGGTKVFFTRFQNMYGRGAEIIQKSTRHLVVLVASRGT